MSTLKDLVEGKSVNVVEATVVKTLDGGKAVIADSKKSMALLLTEDDDKTRKLGPPATGPSQELEVRVQTVGVMDRPSWSSLPVELQLKVLAMLPGAALPPLRLVSTSWRDLADDPLLRAKFHLVLDAGIPPEEIQRLVASKPRLMTVTLQEHQLSRPLLEVMLEHPGLTTIHLQAGRWTDTPYNPFSVILGVLAKPILKRRVAASWLGARLGGKRGAPWGALYRVDRPTLYICATEGSYAFKVLEHTYEIFKFK